jgi:hypothetical protein
MENPIILLQLIVGLVVLNVWIFRFNRATDWRGGTASNMIEEFKVYGLSEQICNLVRVVKIVLAIGLIAGVFYPVLTKYAAAGMLLMMLAAVGFHLKVRDPIKKALPALTMAVLCSLIVVAHTA